jgi:plasmid stabilization system protein ParE
MSDDPKKYRVVVHDDAAQMVYKHVKFLANVSIPAARKLRATLYDAFSSLETMPHRCPVYRTRGTAGTYRQLIIGRYQVIFSINEGENTVNIQHILDSRQNNDI